MKQSFEMEQGNFYDLKSEAGKNEESGESYTQVSKLSVVKKKKEVFNPRWPMKPRGKYVSFHMNVPRRNGSS